MNPESSTTPTKAIKKENFFYETVKFIVIALIIVIPIRTYVAQPFIVKGASMDPTFKDSEYLIVDQLTYHFNSPQRGDVIIFRYPLDPKTFFIKRIIGLPGETLTVRDGVTSIVNKENPKGFEIKDTHVDESNRTYDDFSTTLGATEYFVMGDNRSHSSDSRIWGPLDRKFITGRPLISLYPLSKIGFFPGE